MNQAPERKLAAIMFVDIVGYSRMMAADEARTLELLKDFENICSPIISDNEGEIVKKVGDELFCEFSSAKQAIDCANNGITISSYQSYIFGLIEPIISYDKSSKNIFYKNNKLIEQGSLFKNPAFGDFLKLLIKNGSDYFYKGHGLEIILNFLNNKGNLT